MNAEQYRDQSKQKNHFIELRRVPSNAIAEIHAPGQIRGYSVCIVRESSGEAANTPDGNSQSQRTREAIPRGLLAAHVPIHQCQMKPTENWRPDKRLAAH